MPEPTIRSYQPSPVSSDREPALLFNCIPNAVFANHRTFISHVRAGIPGHWLAGIIEIMDQKEGIKNALSMTSDQLRDACQSETLDPETTEAVLDIARVLSLSISVWESQYLAAQWLKSPVPALTDLPPMSLMDSFEGRRWVMCVLKKIEFGQFS
jgi:putative toxin-antitoxin system antitoxin component (TIGR02293 family)